MHFRSLVTAAVIVMASGEGLAAEVMNLKGIKLGMTIDEVDTLYPSLRCGVRASPEQEWTCEYRPESSSSVDALDRLAELYVGEWQLTFIDRKLEHVMAIVEPGVMRRIEDTLTSKWGKPRIVAGGSVQKGEWRNQGNMLYVMDVARKGSMVGLKSAAFMKREAEKESAAKKRQAKDF